MNNPANHPGVIHPLYPQTVEIPQPLEIHPSVDPELARGLINAVEYINEHPEELQMTNGHSYEKGGCVICHVERLSNWKRPALTGMEGEAEKDTPLGNWKRIYQPNAWGNKFNFDKGCSWQHAEGRIARIEHFLRTGE